MFEKRKMLSYKYEYAVDLMDGNEDVIKLLISKDIIKQTGNLLELDDQFLKFFEDILEVNEEINTAYVNENIKRIKEEYIRYYLQASNDSERYRYLKAVKSSLVRIGTITNRNIVDLNRNIENTFKTEPNFRIKLSKLENHKIKLLAIQQLIEQTEKLLTEDELTFFKNAADEDLRFIRLQLIRDLTQFRQNLIETRKQIIDYINQIKYQSRFIEKLRHLKYLRDQFEIKHKTNIIDVLSENNSLAFEAKPVYPLKLSIENLQSDEAWELIKKVRNRIRTGILPRFEIAEDIEEHEILSSDEKETFIDLHALKATFDKSGKDLFSFVMESDFPASKTFADRVTVYCQLVSLFDMDLEVTDDFGRTEDMEYAIVLPKRLT
jgi:hypothetical protein